MIIVNERNIFLCLLNLVKKSGFGLLFSFSYSIVHKVITHVSYTLRKKGAKRVLSCPVYGTLALEPSKKKVP